MFSYDYLLAAVLLTTPIEPAKALPHLELIQPAFLQLALEMEILDPREEQFLQGMSKDLASDYAALRQRFDMLLDAPMIAECERFQERKLIEDFLAFNRALRMDLLTQLEMNPAHAEQLRGALQEVDQRHYLWSILRDARCRFYYVTVRRQSMQHLRELVGAEAFYRAELPPHVPIWCLPRLR